MQAHENPGSGATVWLSLSLVCFSLVTFSYRAAVLSLLFFAIYFIYARPRPTPKITPALLVSYLSTNALIAAFAIRGDVHAPYLLKYLGISSMFWAILAFARGIGPLRIASAIRQYVFIHAIFFIAQLGYHIATGELLDFNNLVREDYALTISSSRSLDGLGIGIRTSGLFSEPSFYSMSVFPPALLLGLHERRISIAVAAGTLTSFLSLSVAGMVITAAGVLLLLISCKGQRVIKVALIATGFALMPISMTIYERRVVDSIDYDAIASRLLVVEHIKTQELTDSLFGNGMLWNENAPIGHTGLSGYHVRDSSFYIYLLFTTGAIGLGIFILSLITALHRRPTLLVATLVALLFKYGVLVSSLWILLALAIILGRARSDIVRLS